MQFTSPLRYPGGKGRLAEFVGDIMDRNDITGGEYAEVYAGGAGVAITLLLLDFAKKIHINDINKSIFSFWHSVLNEPDELCRRIQDTNVSIEEWKAQKAIQSRTDTSLIDLGFSTFFLNRTNRSGILQGGPIGGQSQTGDWKLDARYNKKNLIERIEAIAQRRHRIELYNLDAKEFIKVSTKKMPEDSLIYLDPPYRNKGSSLYENNYQDEDHIEIANLITKEINIPWLVSYDDDPWIVELYSKYPQRTFGLYYSVGPRYKGAEFMAHSRNIVLPGDVAPRRACRG